MLAVLGLTEDGSSLVADYSTGMRKKIALTRPCCTPRGCCSSTNRSSRSTRSRRTITDVLADFRRVGGTVVFSSHVMDTVERLCDHVAIVAEGRLVRAGSLDEVRRLLAEDAFIDAVGRPMAGTGALDWLGPSGPSGPTGPFGCRPGPPKRSGRA
ncbi:MAG: hypothetical protein R2715_00820 [Ilumatobacteraceae bacterium]